MLARSGASSTPPRRAAPRQRGSLKTLTKVTCSNETKTLSKNELMRRIKLDMRQANYREPHKQDEPGRA